MTHTVSHGALNYELLTYSLYLARTVFFLQGGP